MIGKKVSHYHILEKLGEGGMGVVYKAEDTKLKRTVALKFLPPELTRDPEAKKRFIREAQAASSLQHNNICTIHDVDETRLSPEETGDGQLFICMDYYEGETLEKKIKSGPIKIDKAIDIAVQIAEGLLNAHEKGIVHRDIKPANIFITSKGTVKILDFGLAKVSSQSQMTKVGTSVGTVAYMSPEQANGEEVDNRTDIWSFGIVMYEMLTGQLPFKGDYEQAILYSILNEAPEPITGLRTGVPMELERIIGKILKKNPAERYQNMGDLLVDLKAIIIVNETSKTERKISETKHPGIKRAYVYAGLFVILILIVVGVRSIFTGDTELINSIAVLPLENLSGDPEQEYFVDGMTDALISKLAQISALRVISRTSVMQYKEVRKPISEIARELNVDALVEGTVLYADNQVRITIQLIQASPEQHLWAGDYKRDLRNIFALQEEVAQSIAQEINITITPEEQLQLTRAQPVDAEVYELYLKGYHYFDKVTQNGLEKSVEYYNKALDKDPKFALAYIGLAESYLHIGFRTGFQSNELSLFRASAEKAIELDDSYSETHRLLAMIKFWYEWDISGAEKELKRALELNPNSAPAHDLYCSVLLLLGRLDEAVIEREITFELDPLSHLIHCNGGFTYLWAGQYDQAIEQAEMTIEHFGSACASEDLVIGAAYNQKAMYEKAITVLGNRNAMSKNNSRIIAELGYAYALAGQTSKAKLILDELNELGMKRLGHPYYYLSALINIIIGDKDEVFRLLEKAYEHRDWLFPWLSGDPRFNTVRSDPRFQELVNNINFTKNK